MTDDVKPESKKPKNSKRLKKAVRARMKETGQSYMGALRDVLAEIERQGEEDGD